MRYQAILFDLDGTLLPMDVNEFSRGYFVELCKTLAPYGIEAKELTRSIWMGVEAMVRNTGEVSNEEAFWQFFFDKYALQNTDIKKSCESFYGNEFHNARVFTQDNPYAKKAVALARSKAKKVILATNPLFPMVGQRTRLSWIDLKPEDFDLVTSYESDRFCKPNPDYFRSIMERMELDPAKCLMIGNDEYEDGYSAGSLGMDCYIITDCIVKSEKHPWNGPKGSFQDMLRMLENL